MTSGNQPNHSAKALLKRIKRIVETFREDAREAPHSLITEMSDEDLVYFTLDLPIIAGPLLEHIPFCKECGPRWTSLMDKKLDEEFEKMPEEKRKRLKEMANRLSEKLSKK